MDGSSAQDTQARIAGRTESVRAGLDRTRRQASSLGRKYPVRLVTVVLAALAGIMAGRRRRVR